MPPDFFSTLASKFLAIAIGVSVLWNNYAPTRATEILWDDWGVPHVYAESEAELYFGLGWAQMHNHGNLILELFGKSRGRGAEYWGHENLESDVLLHKLQFPELASRWNQTQDATQGKLTASFVDGMNSYAIQNPGTIELDKRIVLPVTTLDINMHTLFVFYTRFVGGRDLGTVRKWSDLGSNAYAVGPKKSASGNAMLVQNPHLPWSGEFLFFEAQGVAPGINIYGANLVGLPGFGIAFNENLGWTHTNNTIDNADTYELTLQDGGYLLDGNRLEFEKHQETIKVKLADGTLNDHAVEIAKSKHGAVLHTKGNKAVAIRFPALDRVDSAKQWYSMGKARNLQEFETALNMHQIPFWNVIYADKEGNIFYLFNGHVPNRSKGDWQFWDRIVPGEESSVIWNDIHRQDELPRIKNPESGWVQNANDPPWTCSYPNGLDPDAFPAYMAPRMVPNFFRPQRSIRMLAEDDSVTFDELVEYKLSTRLEMADRLLDDLFSAVNQHGNHDAHEAMDVLSAWDRKADADSQGAVLFVNWAKRISSAGTSIYKTEWDPKRPLETPDGFSDPELMVRHLENSAKEIKSLYGQLNVPWGEVVRARVGNFDLPANGADGSVGAFRVASPTRMPDGKFSIRSGDSWVAVVEFGARVRAKVLLSYGNATQKDSPHHGDQLQLFSKKQMRDAWFYREDLDGHIQRRELLQNGVFVVVE